MDSIVEGALVLLRKNGRLSYTELARRLGTTRSGIAARLGPMLASGELKIVAAVHPRLLGLDVLAHIAIRVAGDMQPVADMIAERTPAVLISETVGPYDLVAELHTRGLAELQSSLRAIRSLPGVTEATFMIYEHVLNSFFLGAEPDSATADFDRLDATIIAMLQQDGRTTYRALADAVDLSITAVRSRVQRLIDSGVMRIGALGRRSDSPGNLIFGLGISLEGTDTEAVERIGARRGLEFMARTVGRYDIVATVPFTSMQDFNTFVQELRALGSVRSVAPWLHARIRLERYQLAPATRLALTD